MTKHRGDRAPANLGEASDGAGCSLLPPWRFSPAAATWCRPRTSRRSVRARTTWRSSTPRSPSSIRRSPSTRSPRSAGLLSPSAFELASRFRQDHAKHTEALVRAVERLGGPAAEGRGAAGLPTTGLASETDILRLAASVEKSLALVYLGAVPAFADRELAKAAAGIMGVETMHWAALRARLGEDPAPTPFLG